MRLRHLSLVWLASLVLAVGCSTPEERFAKHLERAESYQAEDRNDDALIEFQSALKLYPEDANVNQRLAELLHKRGTLQAAAFHFGEAYRIDATRLDAGLAQAELLIPTAPQRAEQLIAQAMQANPNDARVYRSESRRAEKSGQTELAIAAAKRGASLAPDDPDSWSQLGAAYVTRVRELRSQEKTPTDELYASGIEAFQKADDLHGGHVGARLEQARLYSRWAGHRESAIESYRGAIKLAKEGDGSSAVAFAAMRLARYATLTEDNALRIEALQTIVDVAPDRVQVWKELAKASAYKSGDDAGQAVYEQLLERQPKSIGANAAYTTYLADRGQELDAIAHLDRVITDGLDDPALWEQLIRLELSSRRFADARGSLEEMKGRHGDAPATHRTTARLAIRENRHEDAIAALQELGSDVTPESERLRALAEMGRGNLDAARAAIGRAMGSGRRGDIATLRLKASIEDEDHDSVAVLETLELIEKVGHKLTPHELVVRARALYDTNQADAGRDVLVAVLQDPISPPIASVEYARFERGRNPQEAYAYLQKALRLAPGNFGALEAITELELQTHQGEKSLARLDKLVESQLAGSKVLLLRARILASGGQLDRAEADALRAFEASPNLEGAVDILYGIYAAQGKLDEALASFEEAESVGVLHSGARVLLARLYMGKGDTEKSKAMYERVIEEMPTNTHAKNDLAYLLASSGDDIDRALSLAEEIQRDKPNDPAIADTVGFVYLKKGRNEVALQQFRHAIEIGESTGVMSPAVHYHMGLALSGLGRESEAHAAFQKALEIDPEFHDAADARQRIGAGAGGGETS